MKNKEYQHKDILQLFKDLSPRSLVSWTEKGLLAPEYGDARGRGTVRKYSFDNVMQIGVIKELMSLGFTFREIKGLFTDDYKTKMKDLKYDCVFFWQRPMLRDGQSQKFEYLFRSYILSMEEFNNLKAESIFEDFDTYINGKWSTHKSGMSIINFTAINVSDIFRMVNNWLM